MTPLPRQPIDREAAKVPLGHLAREPGSQTFIARMERAGGGKLFHVMQLARSSVRIATDAFFRFSALAGPGVNAHAWPRDD